MQVSRFERPDNLLHTTQSVAGPRTVPIEVGANYLHPEWSQKLMTFAQFVDQHVSSSDASGRGYLAQVHHMSDALYLFLFFSSSVFTETHQGGVVRASA